MRRLAIVMDLVAGRELGELLRTPDRQLVPAVEAVRLVDRLLDAVGYVHSHGVVRLDVKPRNVIIDGEGEPVMIDFGVARRLEDHMDEVTVDRGSVIGTPAYMAPEALAGQPVDERSDVFSVGLVLYELLGGDNRADSYHETVRRRIMEDVDVKVLDCSRQLRKVVATCLARDPDQRFPDAASARAALARVPEAA